MERNTGASVLVDIFGSSSIKGVLVSLAAMIGIFGVFIEWKYGFFFTFSAATIFSLMTASTVILRGNLYALPGTITCLAGLLGQVLVRNQLKIRYIEAHMDMLTGIPNRVAFLKTLKAKVNEKKHFYLVLMNLENFKMINDEYGHEVGDVILKEMTQKWMNQKGKDDFLARIGGDEFCLIIPKKYLDNIDEYIKMFISHGARNTLKLESGEKYRFPEINAGIVSFPNDASSDQDLLRKADYALQRAKKSNEINCCIFNREIEEEITNVSQIEEMVKQGLDKELFYMVYQPQFDAKSKKLRGFESLIRLKDENGKVVSPGRFIPVMEKTGTIFKIDFYVVKRTLQDFLPIVEKHPNILVSVNISGKHITDPLFIDYIEHTLNEMKFPARNLEVEITEYSFVYSTEYVIKNLKRLEEMGVTIALDDFGTGYSSLSMISKLPLHLIKIDKSLIDTIHDDVDDKKLVGQIISIGQTLHCEVLSEGIELEEQAKILADQGCNYIQGYLWGKPMEYEDVLAFVEQND